MSGVQPHPSSHDLRSLNADISPEARLDLLDGRVNFFRCERCDCQGLLPVPLLYHDMGRRFMVEYHPFEALDDPEFLSNFDPSGESVAGAETSRNAADGGFDYVARRHVVFHMGELVRYVVFRERLHDHHTDPGH